MAPQDGPAAGGDRPPQMTEMRRLLGAMQRQVETIVRERELTREIQETMAGQLQAASKRNSWLDTAVQIGLVGSIAVMIVLAGMLAWQSSDQASRSSDGVRAEVESADAATVSLIHEQNRLSGAIGGLGQDIQTLNRSYGELHGTVRQMDSAIGEIRGEIERLKRTQQASVEQIDRGRTEAVEAAKRAEEARTAAEQAARNVASEKRALETPTRSRVAPPSLSRSPPSPRTGSTPADESDRLVMAMAAAERAALNVLQSPTTQQPTRLDPRAFGAPDLNDPRLGAHAAGSPTLNAAGAVGNAAGVVGNAAGAVGNAAGGTVGLRPVGRGGGSVIRSGQTLGVRSDGLQSGGRQSVAGSTGSGIRSGQTGGMPLPPVTDPMTTSSEPPGRAAPMPARTASRGATVSDGGYIYTARGQETLREISDITGVAVRDILAANPNLGLSIDMTCPTDRSLPLIGCPLRAGTQFVIPR